MSLFAELKRRNVFKVGAAYLALGWVVVQAHARWPQPGRGDILRENAKGDSR